VCKYIIVSGGVVSGVGKGISAASIGLLMRMRGEKVQVIKFDPYLNLSASLLSPYQHGEVFLCDDGSETDLDLGHYERITGIEVSHNNICTNGSLFSGIFADEVDGKFMGQTVQIVPHVTDKILDKLIDLGKNADIVIAEIGGTVGDFESGHFYEAVRQFKMKLGESNFMLVHVAPVLWMDAIKELKTKPLQNSIRELQRFGLQPDMLLCRIDKGIEIPKTLIDKISHLTSVPQDAIFDAPQVDSVYQVPVCFYDRHIDDFIADRFKLKRNGVRIHKWRELVEKYVGGDLPEINLGIIGKYVKMEDAYMSLKEAIYHAGVANDVKVNIHWIEAEKLEEYSTFRGLHKYFENIHAVIVPGGFDIRGVEGKIKAIQYVREKKIPFLGICLGLQTAVIEFARNVCGLTRANSEEFLSGNEITNPAIERVVHFIEGQEGLRKKGGTLRLGAYDCEFDKDSLAYKMYKKKIVSERHRHRYEVNSKYLPIIEEKGFKAVGINPENKLVEVMELTDHPYYICTQYHGEYKSKLDQPHPLFKGLIEASINYSKKHDATSL
jgi:CTP synthase